MIYRHLALALCTSEYNTHPVILLRLDLVMPSYFGHLSQFLDDRTARDVIGYWHDNVVCLSVCQSVRLYIVSL